MNDILKPVPLGQPIPQNNPYAVSVSLPTLSDVIGYEEAKDEVLNQMMSGYPRFFINKLVEQVIDLVRHQHQIASEHLIIALPSKMSLDLLENTLQTTFETIEAFGVWFIIIKSDDRRLNKLNQSVRNFGFVLSSRQAEDILFNHQKIKSIFKEERQHRNPQNVIQTTLAEAYGTKPDCVKLTNSGTNAIYAAVKSVLQLRQTEHKTDVVQLGWLYLDTQDIIKNCSTQHHVQTDVNDKVGLEQWLAKHHKHIACLVTEVVTNPLVKCVDLVWLYQLCKTYDITLVVDATIPTPYNVEVLKYCDIAVESLTKFACGNADVLSGAVIVNEHWALRDAFLEATHAYIVPLYQRDVERLAFEIKGYQKRVETTSANAKKLYDYLSKQPFAKTIHSVYDGQSQDILKKIGKHHDTHIGLLSVVFTDKFQAFYDAIKLCKGPSLGTEFTLLMPYVYLAYYDKIKTAEGLNDLKNNGLDPNLLRISVGTEPIEELIEHFELVAQQVWG